MKFKLKRLEMDIKTDAIKLYDNEFRLVALAKNLVTIIGTVILDKLYHKFQPVGASFVVILSESSITIHTYPEKELICIEIHTCGIDSNVLGCVPYLETVFGINYKKQYTESDEF